MFYLITSSVTFPELAEKYPHPQRCFQEKALKSTLNGIKSFRKYLSLSRYQLAFTQMWRQRHEHMDMALRHMIFDYLNVVGLAYLGEKIRSTLHYRTGHNFLPIFDTPNKFYFLMGMGGISVILPT